MIGTESPVKISSHFNLNDVDKIKMHHKRLENYKRVLLLERGKKNNIQLKEYIETELNDTLLLLGLLSNIIVKRLRTGLSIADILNKWVNMTEYRFNNLVEGRSTFTKEELNNILLFIQS